MSNGDAHEELVEFMDLKRFQCDLQYWENSLGITKMTKSTRSSSSRLNLNDEVIILYFKVVMEALSDLEKRLDELSLLYNNVYITDASKRERCEALVAWARAATKLAKKSLPRPRLGLYHVHPPALQMI